MADAPWHVFGTNPCPQCGLEVPVAQLLRGSHRCDPADLEARAAEQVEEQAEVLVFELEDFLRGPRGRRQLAFARWCREHGR